MKAEFWRNSRPENGRQAISILHTIWAQVKWRNGRSAGARRTMLLMRWTSSLLSIIRYNHQHVFLGIEQLSNDFCTELLHHVRIYDSNGSDKASISHGSATGQSTKDCKGNPSRDRSRPYAQCPPTSWDHCYGAER